MEPEKISVKGDWDKIGYFSQSLAVFSARAYKMAIFT
jgi:hypothetical protein